MTLVSYISQHVKVACLVSAARVRVTVPPGIPATESVGGASAIHATMELDVK